MIWAILQKSHLSKFGYRTTSLQTYKTLHQIVLDIGQRQYPVLVELSTQQGKFYAQLIRVVKPNDFRK